MAGALWTPAVPHSGDFPKIGYNANTVSWGWGACYIALQRNGSIRVWSEIGRKNGNIMDAYSVRLATPKDAGSIAELKVLCWRQSYQGLVPDHVLSNLDAGTEEPHWRNWLGDEAAGLVAFVCFSGDRLVAYGLAGPMRNEDKPDHPLKVDAEIYALYVHPDHQRQGLGRCLMTEMVCALVEQGHRSLGLWVLGGNKKGEHFYEKLSGQAGPKYVEIRNNRIAFRERAYLWPDLKAFRARLTVKSV